jgi:hypothetical protein
LSGKQRERSVEMLRIRAEKNIKVGAEEIRCEA